MTIQEMQEAKRQTEDQIRQALADFMRKTGLAVRSVEFSLLEVGGFKEPPSFVPGEVRITVMM